MQTLYQLTNDYNQLLTLLDSEEYDEQAIIDTLESVDVAIEDKAQNIAGLIQSLNTDAIDAEIKRLQDRKKAIENKKAWLKKYLQTQMEVLGKDKIKGELFTLAIQNNPPAVNIIDSNLIPAKYQIVKYDTDRAAIKKDLQSGAKVPGAELTQGRSLRIR